MFGRKKDSDDIGPSKGLMKWINRFFRFILYPFIHPWAFSCLVLIIVAAVLIPWLAYKIEFTDIPQWYKNLFVQTYEATSPLKEKVVQKYNEFTNKQPVIIDDAKNKNQDDIIDYETSAPMQRPTFQSDQPEIATPDIAIQRETFQEQADEIAKEADNQPQITEQVTQPDVYFKRNDSLGLSYLDNPEKITGRFTIINANEALINSTSIFLYGVYTPSQNNKNASAYLLKTYDGKQVDCYIGAYTADKHATAICYYENKSINHDMITQGFAQNVSLY